MARNPTIGKGLARMGPLLALPLLAAVAIAAGSPPRVTGRSEITTFASSPGLAGNALAVAPDGTVFTTSAPPDETLMRVSKAGVASPVAAAKGLTVEGLAVARDGGLYISVYDPRQEIRKIGPDGSSTLVARLGASGLALDAVGNLYAADPSEGRIWKIAPNGTKTIVARRLGFVQQIARAPDGTLYTDTGYGVGASGRVMKLPGGGVRAIAMDAGGNVFVATDHYQIFLRRPNGGLTLVAGWGADDYSGDGGPALEAGLSDVGALAFGPDGSLYVDDIGNGAIRRIEPGSLKLRPLPETLPRVHTSTLAVAAPVAGIAADAGWAAADVRAARGGANGTTCDSVVFWSPGASRSVAARDRCSGTNGSGSVVSLALARTRAIWVDYDYGNETYCTLRSATVGRPKPVDLDAGCSAEGEDLVGPIAGQGSLLVFNHWTGCGPGVPCSNPTTVPGYGKVTDPTLERLGQKSSVKLAAGASSVAVAAVDAARIVLVRPDLSVAILSSAGKTLTTVTPGSAVRGAALSGNDLVVLTGRGLLRYDARGGKLLARRALLRTAIHSATLAGVSRGIAAYVSGRTVTLLDLSSGRSTSFRPPSTTRVVAVMTRAGLYYGYSTSAGGRLGFVRASDLVRVVG